jgi:hypothetical protein
MCSDKGWELRSYKVGFLVLIYYNLKMLWTDYL